MRSTYSVPMRPMRQVGPDRLLCECGRCGMRQEINLRVSPEQPECPRCRDRGKPRYMDRYMGMFDEVPWGQINSPLPLDPIVPPPAPVPPAPEPKRTDEETKTAFLELMAGTGLKKKLTVIERVTHEAELGDAEEYKKKLATQVQGPVPENATPVPPPRILCPICHDPMCPWST